ISYSPIRRAIAMLAAVKRSLVGDGEVQSRREPQPFAISIALNHRLDVLAHACDERGSLHFILPHLRRHGRRADHIAVDETIGGWEVYIDRFLGALDAAEASVFEQHGQRLWVAERGGRGDRRQRYAQMTRLRFAERVVDRLMLARLPYIGSKTPSGLEDA